MFNLSSLLKGNYLIKFHPSIQEISESTSGNEYLGGLTEFYISLKDLDESFKKLFFELSQKERKNTPRLEEYTGISIEKGRKVVRAMPPEIAEYIINFGIGGASILFYKLLSLWVKKKNGRKIRVKIKDLEVEATQMTPEEFDNFFKQIFYHLKEDRLLREKEKLKNKLLKQGVKFIKKGNQDLNDRKKIRQAFNESVTKIFNSKK